MYSSRLNLEVGVILEAFVCICHLTQDDATIKWTQTYVTEPVWYSLDLKSRMIVFYNNTISQLCFHVDESTEVIS